jgi:hypothetical protein
MQTLSFYYRWNNFGMAKSYLNMNAIKSFSISKSDFVARSKPWVIYLDASENSGFPSEITFKTKKQAMSYFSPVVKWLNDNGLDIKIN